MVKVTAPLMSHFAAGTLGSTLQYRRGPGGSIALTRPTPRKTTPLALRANAVIVQQAWMLMRDYHIQNSPSYADFAKLQSISNESAYLHFCLARWRRWAMIPFEYPDSFDDSTCNETALAFDLGAPASTPNIAINPWIPDDFLTLHVLFSVSETAGPKNCVYAHNFLDPQVLLNPPHGITGAFYLQAASWKLSGSNPTLSNKLLVTV